VDQAVQVVGALAILLGFALAQAGKLDVQSTPYLTLNFVGSAVLAVLAYHERQWGFLLLEGVWAIVSLWGFYARRRSTPVAPVH
jgi:hypothetical protein